MFRASFWIQTTVRAKTSPFYRIIQFPVSGTKQPDPIGGKGLTHAGRIQGCRDTLLVLIRVTSSHPPQ